MASNPRNVLKSFDRLDQQKKEDDRVKYQLKVVKIIAKSLKLDLRPIMHEYNSLRDDRPELFIQAIKEATGSGFPDELFIENAHKTKFDALALRGHETYWFTRFLTLASENNLPAAGLIFPVMGRKDWIIHNLPVSPKAGKVRLFIPSDVNSIDNVHITSLIQFLEEYRR